MVPTKKSLLMVSLEAKEEKPRIFKGLGIQFLLHISIPRQLKMGTELLVFKPVNSDFSQTHTHTPCAR